MSALDDLISSQFLNSTPAAAFYRQFAAPLAGRNTNYGGWLQGKQNDFYNQYLAGLPDHTDQLYTDFLKQQDPIKQFAGLAPTQRGLNPSNFSPRVRYGTQIGG